MLAHLDEWLDGPGEVGWVVLTGGPGMGKSAILSVWLARHEAASVVPHHFIRRQVADWDQPEMIAASLAAQFEAAFPALRDPEAKPERRLLELLGRVSKQLGGAGRLVVVVDGLDETRAEPGENPLPGFLPHVMPAGIRFLCATRPTYPHLNWLEAQRSVRRLDLDDARWAASNEAVVRGFWEAVGPEYQPPLSGKTIVTAIARAEGNVLHAAMLHDALRDLPAAERHADRVPRGLKALIGEIWDKAASHAAVRVGLGLLCAAQEALSLDVLAEVAGWNYDEKQRFAREARLLLLEEPAAWAGVEAYRPLHDWVRELIAERLGAATIRAHHITLSGTLATWPARSGTAPRRYSLRHALIHRAEAGDWADAWRLASDISLLEAKCREFGVHETEADVTRVAERCRASDDTVFSQRFGDLARALGRESRWLCAAPEATASLVWNRLRRFGWSANDLDHQLLVPVETSFLRVRHVVTRESPALVRELVSHSMGVCACTVTGDGRRVVSASYDRTLKVWDLESGRVLGTLEGHAGAVTGCAVTGDGRRVVSASEDRTLRVWDLESGRAITLRGHRGAVTSCVVTADGRRVVSTSMDKTLKVWDVESGYAVVTLEGHTRSVRACVITADGRHVISASGDETLKVWDLENRRMLVTLGGHEDRVTACAVTADGRRVVSASWDGTLKVWDLESGRALAILEGHTDAVTACVLTADGRHVVSASEDRTLKVWDLESGRALATLEGHTDAVTACVVTADGRHVVSASNDQTLKIWDLERGHACATSEGHRVRVRAITVNDRRQRVVSASDDSTLKVWDLETGRVLATLEGHTQVVNACAVTADGRRVVSASDDRTLKVWDLETGQALASLKGHSQVVTACTVTADGRRAVSGSKDTMLKVWDLESGRAFAILEGHTDWVRACVATADGRRVVSASDDGTLKVWDLESERVLATLQGHINGVNACAVTPDGRRVVSASDDHTLRVWDLESGRVLATLQGHSDWVNACAVTPDGRRVVSASNDRTLKVWDLQSYACLFTHRGDAPYVAVVAGTTSVVAGDFIGGIWFLDWPPSERRATQLDVSGSENRQPETRPAQEGADENVDIGILTIRDDEFRAVLDAFPQKAGAGVHKGANRQYILRHAEVATGERYTVAILRQVEQGNGEAQDAARDLVEDLAPKLVLVVGIAGGLPSDDVTLGDVVLGTRVHDYTVEAVKTGHEVTYAATGGPIDRAIAAAVAILDGRKDELGDWASGLPSQPPVAWSKKGQVCGPPEWQRELKAKLEHHYGEGSARRAPIYVAGPIASSDRLVKDPTVLFPWITTARNLLAVEMESGGVYRAARERCPMLPIRGISDIVGLKRADAWTKFACASAAAFARAFLRTRPVPVGTSVGAADRR